MDLADGKAGGFWGQRLGEEVSEILIGSDVGCLKVFRLLNVMTEPVMAKIDVAGVVLIN
jgi:hypothetical protein